MPHPYKESGQWAMDTAPQTLDTDPQALIHAQTCTTNCLQMQMTFGVLFSTAKRAAKPRHRIGKYQIR